MRYTVKAAARATGVTESALRTWERRYGIPSPGRSPTGRRLYEDADLAVIRRMAALVEAGVPASEAAAAVLTESDSPSSAAAERQPADPLVAEIIAAALDHDEPAVARLVRDSVKQHGWPVALDTVIFGALRSIGGMWQDNRVPSATEHFLTEIVRRQINCAVEDAPTDATGPVVVLACPQDERHDIGLLALSLLLRTDHVKVCYLGADVPAEDLAEVIIADSAAAVCLAATAGSSRASVARTARQIIARKLDVPVFVGGPAFVYQEHDEFVPGIMLPGRLADASAMISARVKKEAA